MDVDLYNLQYNDNFIGFMLISSAILNKNNKTIFSLSEMYIFSCEVIYVPFFICYSYKKKFIIIISRKKVKKAFFLFYFIEK